MLRRILGVALSAPCIVAQTYIVDVANGPGANFTSLAAAVAAVPSGAVLHVRAGNYLEASLTVSGKGLTILADPYAALYLPMNVPLRIDSLAAQQSVAIVGLPVYVLWYPRNPQVLFVQCQNNQGAVLLDSLGDNSDQRQFDFDNCAAVTVRNTGFNNNGFFASPTQTSNNVVGSVAVLEDCTIHSLAASAASVPNALWLQNSFVQLVHCDVLSSADLGNPGAPAIGIQASDLRLLNGTSLARGAAGLAVDGAGVVLLDPSTAIAGSGLAFAPGVIAVTMAMPWVAATEAVLGSNCIADLHGPSGSLGFLAAGQRSMPVLLTGISDPVWLNPATAVVMATGVPSTSSFLMPTAAALIGAQLTWQGLTFDPQAGLQASNPSVRTIH